MKKYLTLIMIIFISIFFYGCSKNSTEEFPVYLSKVDINSLNNKKILSIINDNNFSKGISKIDTNSNNYIYFYGDKCEYIDIKTNLENKTLIINCNITISPTNTKKLYLIRQQSSNLKENLFFNNIIVKINNQKNVLKDIIKIN